MEHLLGDWFVTHGSQYNPTSAFSDKNVTVTIPTITSVVPASTTFNILNRDCNKFSDTLDPRVVLERFMMASKDILVVNCDYPNVVDYLHEHAFSRDAVFFIVGIVMFELKQALDKLDADPENPTLLNSVKEIAMHLSLHWRIAAQEYTLFNRITPYLVCDDSEKKTRSFGMQVNAFEVTHPIRQLLEEEMIPFLLDEVDTLAMK